MSILTRHHSLGNVPVESILALHHSLGNVPVRSIPAWHHSLGSIPVGSIPVGSILILYNFLGNVSYESIPDSVYSFFSSLLDWSMLATPQVYYIGLSSTLLLSPIGGGGGLMICSCMGSYIWYLSHMGSCLRSFGLGYTNSHLCAFVVSYPYGSNPCGLSYVNLRCVGNHYIYLSVRVLEVLWDLTLSTSGS